MISPIIRRLQPELDTQQQAVVGHLNGPLLVIAGPGAGKTRSIVWRAVNLLLLHEVVPAELVLCTFSRRAAWELRQRFDAAASAAQCIGDLSTVRITTVHGLCHRILSRHLGMVGLTPSFGLLDKWDQLDLMSAHCHRIFGADLDAQRRQGWCTIEYALKRACRYFERIAEEGIDPAIMTGSDDTFHAALGGCCLRYEAVLRERGALDLSRLQVKTLALLRDEHVAHKSGSGIKHLMVDEYQDTSHIQGQVLFRLGRFHNNLCVVGDDDQSLYRFRGASVRNMVEFPARFPQAEVRHLTVNYRSHRSIVGAYDRWMASADWTNPQSGGVPFRFGKTILPHAPGSHADYPSVIRVSGTSKEDVAGQLANLLQFLKVHGLITDYGDIALLLSSVKQPACRHYVGALARAGIPYHRAPAASRRDDAEASEFDHRTSSGLGFPKDKVCITTIHQAKGLEWPVVVVGSLDGAGGNDEVGRELDAYSPRTRCEPIDRIGKFDAMRHFYTAFSRPQDLLVLTAVRSPAERFRTIWDGQPRRPHLDATRLETVRRQRLVREKPNRTKMAPTELAIHRVRGCLKRLKLG